MTTAETPDQIRLFQLLSARQAVLLESKGLRRSRFRQGVRGLWAVYYGMPKRSPALAVVDRMNEEIAQLQERLQPSPQLELPI